MIALDNLISGLERLGPELDNAGKTILSSPGFKYSMLNLNRDQMDKGLTSEGQYITLDGSPDYSPFTIQIKNEKGQPTDRITLKDTGQFYDNLNIEFDPEGVAFSDSDLKAFEIEERTGPTIYGLTDDNKGRIIELLLPVMDGEIHNNIMPNLLSR